MQIFIQICFLYGKLQGKMCCKRQAWAIASFFHPRLTKNDKRQLELLFDLVIITVSQFNTKLVALELIGYRDFSTIHAGSKRQ